ncbi:hypothetical protein J2X17_002943 [Flavobacterium aquidurense]|nr:hypothetical protein [Flavobacterium aquidurense]
MNKIFLENGSQQENDAFILEFIFFLIFITLILFCIYNHKNVRKYFAENFPITEFRSHRLYLTLIMLTIIGIKLSYNIILKIYSKL